MIQANLLDLFVVDEPKQECVLAIHFPHQSWLLGDKVTIRLLECTGPEGELQPEATDTEGMEESG